MASKERRLARLGAIGQKSCPFLATGIQKLISGEHGREVLPEMATTAFVLAAEAMLSGLEPLAHLAGATEHCLILLHGGEVDPALSLPTLASGIATLGQALRCFASEKHQDASAQSAVASVRAAKRLSTPLRAATYELQTLYPVPGKRSSASWPGPDVPRSRLLRNVAPPTSATSSLPENTTLSPAMRESIRSAGLGTERYSEDHLVGASQALRARVLSQIRGDLA